jgi:hypothetical protein
MGNRSEIRMRDPSPANVVLVQTQELGSVNLLPIYNLAFNEYLALVQFCFYSSGSGAATTGVRLI